MQAWAMCVVCQSLRLAAELSHFIGSESVEILL